MLLRDFLTPKHFKGNEPTYVKVDPLTQFGYVLDRDGNPQRTRSMTRLEVPLGNWDERRENDLVANLLVRVAMETMPHRARNYSDINAKLWAKIQHTLKCLVLNPEHKDKFSTPVVSKVFYSTVVPLNRVICLGDPARVGTYVEKGLLRGFYVALGAGVSSILINDTK